MILNTNLQIEDYNVEPYVDKIEDPVAITIHSLENNNYIVVACGTSNKIYYRERRDKLSEFSSFSINNQPLKLYSHKQNLFCISVSNSKIKLNDNKELQTAQTLQVREPNDNITNLRLLCEPNNELALIDKILGILPNTNEEVCKDLLTDSPLTTTIAEILSFIASNNSHDCPPIYITIINQIVDILENTNISIIFEEKKILLLNFLHHFRNLEYCTDKRDWAINSNSSFVQKIGAIVKIDNINGVVSWKPGMCPNYDNNYKPIAIWGTVFCAIKNPNSTNLKGDYYVIKNNNNDYGTLVSQEELHKNKGNIVGKVKTDKNGSLIIKRNITSYTNDWSDTIVFAVIDLNPLPKHIASDYINSSLLYIFNNTNSNNNLSIEPENNKALLSTKLDNTFSNKLVPNNKAIKTNRNKPGDIVLTNQSAKYNEEHNDAVKKSRNKDKSIVHVITNKIRVLIHQKAKHLANNEKHKASIAKKKLDTLFLKADTISPGNMVVYSLLKKERLKQNPNRNHLIYAIVLILFMLITPALLLGITAKKTRTEDILNVSIPTNTFYSNFLSDFVEYLQENQKNASDLLNYTDFDLNTYCSFGILCEETTFYIDISLKDQTHLPNGTDILIFTGTNPYQYKISGINRPNNILNDPCDTVSIRVCEDYPKFIYLIACIVYPEYTGKYKPSSSNYEPPFEMCSSIGTYCGTFCSAFASLEHSYICSPFHEIERENISVNLEKTSIYTDIVIYSVCIMVMHTVSSKYLSSALFLKKAVKNKSETEDLITSLIWIKNNEHFCFKAHKDLVNSQPKSINDFLISNVRWATGSVVQILYYWKYFLFYLIVIGLWQFIFISFGFLIIYYDNYKFAIYGYYIVYLAILTLSQFMFWQRYILIYSAITYPIFGGLTSFFWIKVMLFFMVFIDISTLNARILISLLLCNIIYSMITCTLIHYWQKKLDNAGEGLQGYHLTSPMIHWILSDIVNLCIYTQAIYIL